MPAHPSTAPARPRPGRARGDRRGGAPRARRASASGCRTTRGAALLRERGAGDRGRPVGSSRSAWCARRSATVPARDRALRPRRRPAADLGRRRVHFDPGSAAIHILDPRTGARRRGHDRRRRRPRPARRRPAALRACSRPRSLAVRRAGARSATATGSTSRCATAQKPVVTGTFRADGFAPMREMLAAVRGSDAGARGAAARDLRLLPEPAARMERPHLPGAARLRARRHPGRTGLDAAGRRHRAGHAAGGGGAALRREPLRASCSTSSRGPARRSSGAARPRPSTCATARRRWARSRR